MFGLATPLHGPNRQGCSGVRTAFPHIFALDSIEA